MNSISPRIIFTQRERHVTIMMNKDKMKESGRTRCLEHERQVQRRLNRVGERARDMTIKFLIEDYNIFIYSIYKFYDSR